MNRILVIGAGIVGACCAVYLRRDGHEVTLLEAEEPAAGASRGNAGALSPGSCIPLAMPGMLRKVPGWLGREGPLVVRPTYLPRALPWLLRHLAAGRHSRIDAIADALRALHEPVFENYEPLLRAAGAEELVRRSGSLVAYLRRASFRSGEREWDMRRVRGATFEVLDAPALQQLVPALAESFECAVLQPDHGFVVDPRALVDRLVKHLRSSGGQYLHGRALGLQQETEGVSVHLHDGGRLQADRVVVAAGVWSRRLVSGLGLRLPLESQRGYHLQIFEPGIDLPLPISFADGKFYATPMRGGLRLAGTVEFAGLDAPPDPERARSLATLARRWLPGLRTAGSSWWMGHRPCLPDSLPVIGALPCDPRVLLAFGHGHNGMTSAPTTGRLVADMVAGRRPAIDPSPYRPERF